MDGRQISGRTLIASRDLIPISSDSNLDLSLYISREISLHFLNDSTVTILNGVVSNPRQGDDTTHITGQSNEVFDVLVVSGVATLKLTNASSSTSTNVDGGTF